MGTDYELSHIPALHYTPDGHKYFREPGAIIVAHTVTTGAPSTDGLSEFLGQFDDEFLDYLDDYDDPVISMPDQVMKLAGQLCYLSFGPKRTMNVEADKYFGNLISQDHTSVLEHGSFTALCWGVSRSLTHELVRHRIGVSFSQTSQRYIDAKHMRFVMRPEYDGFPDLEDCFEHWIDSVMKHYHFRRGLLSEAIPDEGTFGATARRKILQQTARACLPNETEAPIMVTFNAQSFRHFLYRRGSEAAEPEIRRLATLLFSLVKPLFPLALRDFYRFPGHFAEGVTNGK
jgi:thymidylate synthase (FAD)